MRDRSAQNDIYIKHIEMFQRLQPPVVELAVLQGSENWSHPISFHRSRKANNNSNMGFNQRKLPDRTVCVAVDLSAAFDTVCHNKLMSKINRSPFPRPHRDGYPAISEDDKPRLASEV